MTVTVTLQDEGGNGIPGKAGDLAKAGAVTVPGAKATGVTWTEGTAGQYTATYTAYTVVTARTATLDLGKLDGTGTKASAAYTIKASDPVKQNSSIRFDKASYYTNTGMQLTVTLKDAAGNPVTGKAIKLYHPVAPNTYFLAPDYYKEVSPGQYVNDSALAATRGSALHATINVGGEEVESPPYDVVPTVVTKFIAGKWDSDPTWDITSGFPSVAEQDLAFMIKLEGADQMAYRFETSSPALERVGGVVDDPYFRFAGPRPPSDIVVTGYPQYNNQKLPESAGVEPVTFHIRVKTWFTSPKPYTLVTFDEANDACTAIGLEGPGTGGGRRYMEKLTGVDYVDGKPPTHVMGSLFGEWSTPSGSYGEDISGVWTHQYYDTDTVGVFSMAYGSLHYYKRNTKSGTALCL